MTLKKLTHEIFRDFKESDYFKDKRKRKTITNLIALSKLFLDVMTHEGLIDFKDSNPLLYINKNAREVIAEFVIESENDFSWFIFSAIQNSSNYPLECLKSMSYTLLTFAHVDHKKYSVSGTLCSIFKEVKTIKQLYKIAFDYVKSENSLCFDFSRMKSRYFNNINAYAYYAGNTEVVVTSFFADLKLKDKTSYFGCSVRIDSKSMVANQDVQILICNNASEEVGRVPEFSNEYTLILRSVVNAIAFLSNPSGDTVFQERIAEISSKRSRRVHQLKHYSDSDYTEIDLNVEKIRAYEQGKSWYRCAHTRWQRCGKGLSEVKLVFLAPQFPERKKSF